MSDFDPSQEVKALLPEGEYPSEIVDLEAYDSRATGNSMLRIWVMVEGHKLVVYQVCGPVLRAMILASKERFIGNKMLAKVTHSVYGERTFQDIRAMAAI